MKHIFLSIIIPAYKEATRIETTLLSLERYFKNKVYSYEIIVVNDGSPDNLVAVIGRHMENSKNIRLINNNKNHGKGYAVKCGMHEARGDYALFMDADNSVSISHLDSFMHEIARGSDVVIGSIEIGTEKKNERNGLHRRILSKLSKAPVRFFATPGIYDTQRGFKLFSRKAIEIIFPRQTIDRFAFDIEILVIAIVNGLKLKEIPVIFDNPVGSTVRFSAYLESLLDLFKITLKKALGLYHSPHLKLIRVKSTPTMSHPRTTMLFICLLASTALFFNTRANMVVNATSQEVIKNSPSWLYERVPTTKSTTTLLLGASLAFLLLGSDLVSGLVLPQIYASMRRKFLAVTPLPMLVRTRRRYLSPNLMKPV